MPFERWGSLSVADHIDTAALAVNVLLYDRLVIPVMTDQPDRDERAYWVSKGWDPDLQARRLDDLEEIAVRRPWNVARRQLFKSRADELEAERLDAGIMDGQGLTRRILAQEQVVDRPAGVQGVDVIAAYNSIGAARQDFHLTERDEHLSSQAYLLTRRLAVPDLRDPEDALRESIKLSRDKGFHAKRAELFDWQRMAHVTGVSPQEAVERISEMTDAYNDQVRSAAHTVAWKLAFTICGIGLGFATGGAGAAAAAAALSLVQFALLDRKPAIEPGSSRPAAMFHDIEAKIGMKLL